MVKRTYPYNLDFIQKAASGLAPVKAPMQANRYHLGLGVTTRCNFDCPICYYHGPSGREKGRDMELTLLKRALESLPRLAGIIFGLEGEPLLHPEILAMLRLAANHANSLVLITNASLITSSLCEQLADLRKVHVFLSTDAAEASLYEQLRPGGEFNNFRKNAAMLAKSVPTLLHATIFKQNLDSLVLLPALAADLGIGRVSFQQLRSHPGAEARGAQAVSRAELLNWLPALLSQAKKYSIAVELDRFFGGPGLQADLWQLKTEFPFLAMPNYDLASCVHADNLAGICADGSLFPCAGDFEPASMREYSFDAIFNHPYLQALRAMRGCGQLNAACRACMNMS